MYERVGPWTRCCWKAVHTDETTGRSVGENKLKSHLLQS